VSAKKTKVEPDDSELDDSVFEELCAGSEDFFVPNEENNGRVTAQSFIPMHEELLPVLTPKGLPSGHVIHAAGESDSGKCLSRGTPVIMADGLIKKVEDVVEGDLLMGPDGLPRRVIKLGRGREKMYDVLPNYGEKWGCNESHILSLKYKGFRENRFKRDEIVNISVKDYLELSFTDQKNLKLWRTGVEFEGNDLPFDPRWVGMWLGDGTINLTIISNPDQELEAYFEDFADRNDLRYRKRENGEKCPSHIFSTPRGQPNHLLTWVRENLVINGEKRIPHEYKTASRRCRLLLLAGLLDTDGFQDGSGFEIATKYVGLRDDILFLARSLGLRATYAEKTVRLRSYDFEGVYHRIYISGDCDEVPTLIARKQAPKRRDPRDHLVTGFELIDKGEGDYYGFTLDGSDRLFLLGDFTVTHNTTLVVDVMCRVQEMGGLALYGLTEIKFDIDRAKLMGFNRDKAVFYKPPSLEKLFELGIKRIEKFRVKYPSRPIVWVWDSISATPSEYELDDETKNHNMKTANAITGCIRRSRHFIDREQVCFLMINRVYTKQTKSPWEKQTATYGGKAPKGFSSIELQFARTKSLSLKRKIEGKDKKIPLGIQTKIENTKNHLYEPFHSVEVKIDKYGFVVGGRKPTL